MEKTLINNQRPQIHDNLIGQVRKILGYRHQTRNIRQKLVHWRVINHGIAIALPVETDCVETIFRQRLRLVPVFQEREMGTSHC